MSRLEAELDMAIHELTIAREKFRVNGTECEARKCEYLNHRVSRLQKKLESYALIRGQLRNRERASRI